MITQQNIITYDRAMQVTSEDIYDFARAARCASDSAIGWRVLAWCNETLRSLNGSELNPETRGASYAELPPGHLVRQFIKPDFFKQRKARRQWHCLECRTAIEPGTTYIHTWTGSWYEDRQFCVSCCSKYGPKWSAGHAA